MSSKQHPKHPMQPIEKDIHGRDRFKENKIVRFLLDFSGKHGTTLNELSCMDFAKEDWIQFAQLIGYSVSGFGELSYVDDATYSVAQEMCHSDEDPRLLRLAELEERFAKLKKDLAKPMAELFEKHPSDFE